MNSPSSRGALTLGVLAAHQCFSTHDAKIMAYRFTFSKKYHRLHFGNDFVLETVQILQKTTMPRTKERDPEKAKHNKKRKVSEIAEPVAQSETSDVESSPKPATKDASPSPPPTTDRPSKKRKSSLASEIEVDITLPEPPSKKALRRLKKGKPLPPSKSGADSDADAESGTAADGTPKPAKPEVEKRSEHGIWIGNLPWSVTKDILKKFFVENSNIEDAIITRIHMPSPDDGKPANRVSTAPTWKKQNNKGFAYVDFSTADAVTEAVGLSEELLQGRRVLIKNAKSFDGRPMKSKDEEKKDGKEPSKRIFIGNLRFDATEENVKEHFEQCGPIEHIMIATFEDSGKCKGYGWITFQTLEAAEQAVKGWVPVQEEQDESESDLDSDSDSSDSDSDNATPPKHVAAPATKKPTNRRHFIDKIAGRPIRREFAEPAQVRYKKRYGKDGTKYKNAGGEGGADGEAPAQDRERKPRAKVTTEYEPLGTSYAPRLTGAIRKPEGKKVVF